MEMSLRRQADKIDVHRVNNTHKQGLQPFADASLDVKTLRLPSFLPSFFSPPLLLLPPLFCLLIYLSFFLAFPPPLPFNFSLPTYHERDRNRRRAHLTAKSHESSVLHFNSSVDVLDGSLRLFIFSTDGLEMQIHLGGGREACSLSEEGRGELRVLKEVWKRREVAEECYIIVRGWGIMVALNVAFRLLFQVFSARNSRGGNGNFT